MTTTSAPVESTTLDADGVPLAARIARPAGASRALILVLHGGTYDSEYYQAGDDSLLALGPGLGYTVVAVDRPGYGGSTAVPADRLGFDAQTKILTAAMESLAASSGLPLVLVGHSIGGMLALLVAASSATPRGVEISGLGELWQPGVREMWGGLRSDAPAIELPPEAHAGVMLGADDTVDGAAAARDGELMRPMPMPELDDVIDWADRLPTVGAAVTAPVRLTFAEQDKIWRSDDEAMAAAACHFTGPFAATRMAGVGHSIELHRRAREYALSQLSFVEQSIA
ncbi:alpha/beta hydrolase [Tsukamurella sp. 8F]|uniref:alpha/beta hydrolase n=1 Tax=unclassified Tsukamurella TaxID=2633480 RepID=UPI0023B984E3|nr:MULTISPECIES: alpha/beta hydrolase [unclassified Tsukamurella]MDF0531209.1 alpha/beta hydrolase [Tsukamurella sp. 8J]MDF0588478.1 alpha/beta hydrolase [Tsukamurella sp. 8F]